MNFPSEYHGKIVVIVSNVEKLDTTNAAELKTIFTVVNKTGNNKIVFNLEKTKYCDSSGLSAILVANRLCKDTNGAFVMFGLQPTVMKMVEIAQLNKVLQICTTKEEALSSLEQAI
jgi:anti-sigma B factor antagonist